jgi:lipopolysaccharide export system protein LptA
MQWQRKARLAIATFVILFAAIVVFTMRQRSVPAPPPSRTVPNDGTIVSSQGSIAWDHSEKGRLKLRLRGKDHKVFPGGRTEISAAVVTVPDRGDGTVTIRADKAELQSPPGKPTEVARGTFTGNVALTTDKGVAVSANQANYDEASGIVSVPGPVQFSRGRMSGRGVGGSYDKNRDVLSILDQARATVAPDPSGTGGAEATAGAMSLARADNYIRLTTSAQIVAEGRTAAGDEITAWLNADGETIRQLDIRGNSRITGTATAMQNMSARDIDLTYASDGRTLQGARLMENSIVDLPGADGAAGRRIAGRTVELAMSPDGATLTGLKANDDVQVDLPAAGDVPARRICSRSLDASGPPGAGLQDATFTGSVEYLEHQAPGGSAAAIDRTARANRLILATKPGLGEIERADFLGNFTMREDAAPSPQETGRCGSPPATGPPQVSAGAPRALYHVSRDLVELSPQAGEPGSAPFVNDGRMRVSARTIRFSPSSRKLSAETDVQSTMQPQRRTRTDRTNGGGRAAQAPAGSKAERMPAMLDEDKPVTVVANRLEYDGTAEATYTGKARLWQDQSKIDADIIVLNDRTGNLTARTNVRTTMLLEDTDPQTKQRSVTETVASADTLVYEDDKRLATYTGTGEARARMKGVHGDVTADRIEVFLDDTGNRLERAIATDNVVVKEGLRTAVGRRLVYTAADETYVMTGSPVEAFEQETPNSCKITVGSTLTFQRAVGSIRAETSDLHRVSSTTVASPCPAERRD